MKIKKSAKLNQMLQELYDIDFFYVDDILSQQADFYTISDKTRPEEGFDAGFKLCLAAQKKNLPIYEVECYRGDFSVYFIGNLKKVQTIFAKALKEAKENDAG